MSHIFDALQRAETGQSGSGASHPSEVAELLLRAERRTIRKWEAATGSASAVAEGCSDSGSTAGIAEELPGEPAGANIVDSAISGIGPRAEDLNLVQANLLGEISDRRLVCLSDGDSPAAEAFRLLGVRVRHMRRSRSLKRILITSSIPQEGKSTVAANLACALAQRTDEKILLLEGDLRRPSLPGLFGLDHAAGLSEYLQDDCGGEPKLHRVRGPSLWVLLAGSHTGNALDLLQSKRLPDLIERLSNLFDWIIIDSPPVLPLADTSVWVRLADGVLLVTRQGVTRRRLLQRGLGGIEPAKLIGAILNSSPHPAGSDYYYRVSARLQQDQNS